MSKRTKNRQRTKDRLGESGEDALFLLLFYRERVGRFADRLRSQEDYSASMRRKHRKDVFRDSNVTLSQAADFLAGCVRRAEDKTRCNSICKSLYFCDREKDHKGKHADDMGLSWD